MSNLCQGANKFVFYVCYKYMRKHYYTYYIVIVLKSFQKRSLYFYYLNFGKFVIPNLDSGIFG